MSQPKLSTRKPLGEAFPRLASPKPSRRKVESHTSPVNKCLGSVKGPTASSSMQSFSALRSQAVDVIAPPSNHENTRESADPAAGTKPAATKREHLAVCIRSQQRERAHRMQADLTAHNARRRRFHELPGNFEADRLMRIRADVSFEIMCEALAKRDKAAGIKHEDVPRDLFK
ncbi:hypothetical protein PHYPSEUDO_003562 [Phytophthora pseudosyringae]|uniref:Uncharacterized protein n=1 Tax=Phytophthora pseudosyringae TaxID=221518 RepID=A0A8T1VR17_9STRA|nr:hypothetical protein PHYPSEUDO_003562 [Phytophthora pseudosyringae]